MAKLTSINVNFVIAEYGPDTKEVAELRAWHAKYLDHLSKHPHCGGCGRFINKEDVYWGGCSDCVGVDGPYGGW